MPNITDADIDAHAAATGLDRVQAYHRLAAQGRAPDRRFAPPPDRLVELQQERAALQARLRHADEKRAAAIAVLLKANERATMRELALRSA